MTARQLRSIIRSRRGTNGRFLSARQLAGYKGALTKAVSRAAAATGKADKVNRRGKVGGAGTLAPPASSTEFSSAERPAFSSGGGSYDDDNERDYPVEFSRLRRESRDDGYTDDTYSDGSDEGFYDQWDSDEDAEY